MMKSKKDKSNCYNAVTNARPNHYFDTLPGSKKTTILYTINCTHSMCVLTGNYTARL